MNRLHNPSHKFNASNRCAIHRVNSYQVTNSNLPRRLIPVITRLHGLRVHHPSTVTNSNNRRTTRFDQVTPQFTRIFSNLFATTSMILRNHPTAKSPLRCFNQRFNLIRIRLTNSQQIRSAFHSASTLSATILPSCLPGLSFSHGSSGLPEINDVARTNSTDTTASVQ